MLQEAYVCLALNMYHEARGEGPVGMVAVGQTTLNRAASGDKRWPSDVCKVVQQMRTKKQCQFSWFCDGASDKPEDKEAYKLAKDLAVGIISGYIRNPRLSRATCYHASWAEKPSWTKGRKPLDQIGDHIFYAC